MSTSVPEISPPVIVALPEFRAVAVTVANEAVPPVSVTLFEDKVEKVPAAEVAAPITTPSIAPPSKSTTDEVKFAPEIAPPVI